MGARRDAYRYRLSVEDNRGEKKKMRPPLIEHPWTVKRKKIESTWDHCTIVQVRETKTTVLVGKTPFYEHNRETSKKSVDC